MASHHSRDTTKLSLHAPPSHHLHLALLNLHSNCHGFFRDLHSSLHRNFSSLPRNPNIAHLTCRLQFAFSNLHDHARRTFEARFSASDRAPAWARIASPGDAQVVHKAQQSGTVMSNEDIEERLSGVLVYALCNSVEDFVLISGPGSKGSLSLFCFREEDANSILKQMRSVDPLMSIGTRVIALPLNKVYRLKADGVAFRFLPEASQVKNAVQEMQRAGQPKGACRAFSGVPVFQSQSLILKGQNMTYRPVFFRKEDLEVLLRKAYGLEGSSFPIPKPVDIQIGAFEDIISGMKDTRNSEWDDVVFIPPGFDIGSDPSRIRQSDTPLPRLKN